MTYIAGRLGSSCTSRAMTAEKSVIAAPTRSFTMLLDSRLHSAR